MNDIRNFITLLHSRWDNSKTLVCIGLDSEYKFIPESIRELSETKAVSASLFRFNKEIIDTTSDLVCCYKIQIAFYAAEGIEGLNALRQTIEYVHTKYPDIPVILDAKRSDIASTAEKYANELFDFYQADAATILPFFGRDACEPYLKRSEKGLFFICHTSNPGATEFQELMVSTSPSAKVSHIPTNEVMPLYQMIAHNISSEWNIYGNCGLVVGATYPNQLAEVRNIVKDMPILIPGIGKQQGDIKSTVKAGRDSRGHGMIISSSRGIIFASSANDFASAARKSTEKLRDQINAFL